ncbi:MAG TPA: glycosyltransferase family A protein [Chitinispirillaceae bacterium]|nr:glycosyltransferase family A protein [Chitinispirillaceae bacterium]
MKIQYSIVIPTRNRSQYLTTCCKEIHAQLQGNKITEVIVIDDGSPKKTADQNRSICEKYGCQYTYQSNRGMAVARNTGIAQCTGKWVIFLDDDVLIANGWFVSMMRLLPALPESVAGIEGMVEGTGDGVWDREVQNLEGGAFLTCHLAVRRDTLIKMGGFDTAFEKLGPFCEDHELAARLLKKGEVKFDTTIKVTHLPRNVHLLKYLFKAPSRISGLLKADCYFYCRHPHDYQRFRHAKTFAGTCYSILFKNVFQNLKRRPLSRLAAHPCQSATLIVAALIEQVVAWLLLPVVLKNYWTMMANKKEI